MILQSRKLATALLAAVALSASSIPASAQASGGAPLSSPAPRAWSSAVFVELASAFVPVANDVPLMVGVLTMLLTMYGVKGACASTGNGAFFNCSHIFSISMLYQ